MADADRLGEWWTKTLLGQSRAAHPVHGDRVKVNVTRDQVELKGKVETPDEAEDLQREARSYASGRNVANHIKVVGGEQRQHMQTVVSLFPSEDTARVAAEEVHSWGWNPDRLPEVIASRREARSRLSGLAKAAGLAAKECEQIMAPMNQGHAMLVIRLPEDDAFRVVSKLEGSDAEMVTTLPPEPEGME